MKYLAISSYGITLGHIPVWLIYKHSFDILRGLDTALKL
jgi:hypothetical protein